MPVIKGEFGLSKEQLANIAIASVAVTIFGRLLIGPLCDTYGPRLVYTCLLGFGALPVMGLALVHRYTAFLSLLLMNGVIGASLVIPQYPPPVLFAPTVVGPPKEDTRGNTE